MDNFCDDELKAWVKHNNNISVTLHCCIILPDSSCDLRISRIEYSTWIDWDQQGRLVFARGGKLFASLALDDHPLQVREIADFNKNTPTSLVAPYQTKQW